MRLSSPTRNSGVCRSIVCEGHRSEGGPVNGTGTGLAGLLMLADARLPAGGHAHSGGVEAAVAAGWVRTVADLAVFLRGRLRTAGAVAAGLAAAACADPAGCDRLDAEADARMPSPAQRAASRQQGR